MQRKKRAVQRRRRGKSDRGAHGKHAGHNEFRHLLLVINYARRVYGKNCAYSLSLSLGGNKSLFNPKGTRGREREREVTPADTDSGRIKSRFFITKTFRAVSYGKAKFASEKSAPR